MWHCAYLANSLLDRHWGVTGREKDRLVKYQNYIRQKANLWFWLFILFNPAIPEAYLLFRRHCGLLPTVRVSSSSIFCPKNDCYHSKHPISVNIWPFSSKFELWKAWNPKQTSRKRKRTQPAAAAAPNDCNSCCTTQSQEVNNIHHGLLGQNCRTQRPWARNQCLKTPTRWKFGVESEYQDRVGRFLKDQCEKVGCLN